jgi:DNA polymerase I-like protein with 3'-5' exonuclease and polymerase domains
MDELAKHYLNKEKIGKELDATRMASYHAGDVAPRAEGDVALTGELREAMWPLLDAEDLQRVRQLEDEVIYPVCEMERNGAPIDRPLLEQYQRECTAEHERLLLEIQAEVGFAFDHTPTSWQRLFEKYQLPMSYLDSEKPSFAEEVIAEVDHPIVVKAHYAGQLASLNSKTFAAYARLIDSEGVLRYDINQLRGDEGGTVSGRFSIGYIQQVPNHDNHSAVFGEQWFPRRLFISRSGLYLAGDAAQIEYRVFASYAGNPRVLQAYADDPDLSFHKMTWEMIKPFKPDMSYTHQKSMNFMKLYAGKLIKLAVMMGHITRREGDQIKASKTQWTDPRLATAREIERIYARQLPEVDLLTKRAEHLAKTKCDKWCKRGDRLHREFPHRGYVRTASGRRSRFADGYKTYRALNRVISGTAADINKQKLVELHRERKRTGFLMRMTVHDEVGGDAQTPETATMVSEILNRQSFPELKVPIRWSVKTGANWAEAK